MEKIAKGLLALNLASAIRLARFGVMDAKSRLWAAYNSIDPFGAPGMTRGADLARNKATLARIPEVQLTSIVSGRPIVKVESTYSYHPGSLPWCDILALLAVLVDRAPRTVLEIGTFNGHTTRLLALNMPSATIHTVDLPEDYDVASEGSSMPKDDFHLIKARKVGSEHRSDPSIINVVQHFGDTATWDFGLAEGATFYYIDGAHTHEYARNDTEKALAAARGRDATLLWHDVDQDHSGVLTWLDEMLSQGHPVKRIQGTHLAIMDTSA
jgi:Methyltransferase domain